MKALHWNANVMDDRTIRAWALDAHIAPPVAAADPIRLTPDDDHFVGTNSTDEVFGLAGDDFLEGRDGGDRLWGGKGNDSLNGDRGKDILHGGDGSDSLKGAQGRDHLFGGDGDDRLGGGLAGDRLVGGAGADRIDVDNFVDDNATDRIVYRNVADSTPLAFDTVDNFKSGEDKVFLSPIDANSNTPGDDAFTYIGTAAFSGTAGELRIQHFNAGGPQGDYLLGDTDGDGQADLMIQFDIFDGSHVLATDIVL